MILPTLLGDHSGMGRAGSVGKVATGGFTELLIGLAFGLIFVEVNSGDLPHNWSFGLRMTGVLIAVILLVGLLWRRRWLDQAGQAVGRFGRRYWAVVAVEVVVLLAVWVPNWPSTAVACDVAGR